MMVLGELPTTEEFKPIKQVLKTQQRTYPFVKGILVLKDIALRHRARKTPGASEGDSCGGAHRAILAQTGGEYKQIMQ